MLRMQVMNFKLQWTKWMLQNQSSCPSLSLYSATKTGQVDLCLPGVSWEWCKSL